MARILVSRYGPRANPDAMVTLRCDKAVSIVNLARCADVIVLTVKAVATELVSLNVTPSLGASARFGLATLSDREEAPSLQIVAGLPGNWIGQLQANQSLSDL